MGNLLFGTKKTVTNEKIAETTEKEAEIKPPVIEPQTTILIATPEPEPCKIINQRRNRQHNMPKNRKHKAGLDIQDDLSAQLYVMGKSASFFDHRPKARHTGEEPKPTRKLKV